MGANSGGSVFWAFSLVLFPVAVQLSSPGCVTYKHREICGLKGSSVEFLCSYPPEFQIISMSGWSRKLNPKMKLKPLKQMPAYSLQMRYLELGNNDCTMKLADLEKNDASIYYFVYSFRNVTGYGMMCKGIPGVRLQIFASPVSIQVESLVRDQDVPVADWTVIEGQRIMLTCVPTCAANLNSNPGYIWYKNRLQLNGSRANSRFLSLDPISNEDMGSYVCVMIGYKDLPSSAVNLTVQRRPRNIEASDETPDSGSESSMPALSNGCEAQNSTDQICQTPKSMFTFSILLVASVCVGLVIAIMVSILFLKVRKNKRERRRRRKKKKSRGCACSVPRPPNSDLYMALDINSMSAEYDTLDPVRRCSAADTVYENLHQPGKSTG